MRRSVGSVEDESGIRARCNKRTVRLTTAESAIEVLVCASDCHSCVVQQRLTFASSRRA
jgi:hypothetical protein